MKSDLLLKDKKLIWHPYTQMLTAPEHIGIVKGKDASLIAEDGTIYIDAISSWWVNIHGHGNKYIAERLYQQALELEHCIFAGFTHPAAVRFAERLLPILPGNQSKVFYSDNGSTAVEVALKMAIQYWTNQGLSRPKLLAFHHAYHGDTFGAMSVSGRSIFTKAFDHYLFDVEFIDLPTASNIESLQDKIRSIGRQCAGFIFEPLILGSGGMLMYEPEQLERLLGTCSEAGILIIADEVMTGFGRTGKNFAMQHLDMEPDIICLSKGITGGTMAMGVTTCKEKIYQAFLSEDKLKTLFHGHSYTANAITCATAMASLDIFLSQTCQASIQRISARHRAFAETIAGSKAIKNIRQHGTIIAFDVKTDDGDSYTSNVRDSLYAFFLKRQVLLRPLGNTLYIMPPYCITDAELDQVYSAILELLDTLSS